MFHMKLIQHTIFNPPRETGALRKLQLYLEQLWCTITRFGAYLHPAGTQHANLHQLSVTMSRVT